MPVYNAGRYLAEAVESILGQTYGPLELIAVDDGSTDDSLAILKRYSARDPRVRLISRPNTGYSVALNEALGLASGEFLARMDADDVSDPERFAKQVEFLRRHPECVAVGCRVLLIDYSGGSLGIAPGDLDHETILGHLLKGLGAAIPHPGLMARAGAVRELGGYRVEFEPVEDLDLFLRLADLGRLANHPDVLLSYRQHAQSVSHRRHAEQLRKARLVVMEAFARRGRPVGEDFQLVGWPDPSGVWRFKVWFWSALTQGRTGAARHFAVQVVKARPFSVDSWRIAYHAVRGR